MALQPLLVLLLLLLLLLLAAAASISIAAASSPAGSAAAAAAEGSVAALRLDDPLVDTPPPPPSPPPPLPGEADSTACCSSLNALPRSDPTPLDPRRPPEPALAIAAAGGDVRPCCCCWRCNALLRVLMLGVWVGLLGQGSGGGNTRLNPDSCWCWARRSAVVMVGRLIGSQLLSKQAYAAAERAAGENSACGQLQFL
jgi:hypothetical protein